MPNAGRAATSVPPTESCHRLSNGTATCTVPACTGPDAGPCSDAPGPNGVEPLRSVAAIASAPPFWLAAAPAAVSSLRTGVQAVFS